MKLAVMALALALVTFWTCRPFYGPAYGPGMTLAQCDSYEVAV